MKIHVIALAISLTCVGRDEAEGPVGDWVGTFNVGGESKNLTIQVIAIDSDRYEAHLLNGFEESGCPFVVLGGTKVHDEVLFTGPVDSAFSSVRTPGGPHGRWTARIIRNRFAGRRDSSGEGERSGTAVAARFEATRTVRYSPTLGANPPAGAVILLGSDTKLDAWSQFPGGQPADWKLENGVLEVAPTSSASLITRQAFGSCRLHIEFRTPLTPELRGQHRGNSGVYLSGRYEVQILDSYGLPARNNECGAIYNVKAPRLNMCAPPLQWQTYDMEFIAPEYAEGRKTKDAVITVTHNGVVVHDRVAIPAASKGGLNPKEDSTGPLMLPNHRRKVEFRNIWIVPGM